MLHIPDILADGFTMAAAHQHSASSPVLLYYSPPMLNHRYLIILVRLVASLLPSLPLFPAGLQP
jgi:hypothetical protein